jgi:hypothetical protein
MTIFGHDPFLWPYLVIAQMSVFKGSINPKNRRWGFFLDQGVAL